MSTLEHITDCFEYQHTASISIYVYTEKNVSHRTNFVLALTATIICGANIWNMICDILDDFQKHGCQFRVLQ